MSKGSPEWRVAANTGDQVGEGPVYCPQEDALYWVDVLGQAVNRLLLAGGDVTRWPLDEPIGFLVPRRDRPGFVAGLRSGFYALRFEPLRCEKIADPEPTLTGNRFNDGKVDSKGRLWAGTMPMDGDSPSGTLYRLDPDHRWHVIDSGYCVSNGPAFSPRQDRLYHADSALRVIYRFDLDDTGNLHDKQPFIRFPAAWGQPDGMTVDAEGCLWVAHWDGGRVSRFDPDGALDRAIALPASRITSCTFAGLQLDRLFVTSARHERGDEALAGALFELAPGVAGLPSDVFAG